ncbi:unnamed protein product, partial [Prorocentrum cordatum]
ARSGSEQQKRDEPDAKGGRRTARRRRLLGMGVNEALAVVQRMGSLDTAELSFDERGSLDTDLCLRLPALGAQLCFDAFQQDLRVIVVRFRHGASSREGSADGEEGCPSLAALPPLAHAGRPFGGMQQRSLSLRDIYAMFGLTWIGEFRPGAEAAYLLKYRGLTFEFPLPEDAVEALEAQGGQPMELPGGGAPTACCMWVYAKESPSFLEPAPPLQDAFLEKVVVRPASGVEIGGRLLQFGCTPQDMLSDFGPPEQVCLKDRDAVRTHSASALPSHSFGPDYFYNYFRMGFDVLFDGQTHLMKKVILHTNPPTHELFSRYSRCFFQLPVALSAPRSDEGHDEIGDLVLDGDGSGVEEDLDADREPAGEAAEASSSESVQSAGAGASQDSDCEDAPPEREGSGACGAAEAGRPLVGQARGADGEVPSGSDSEGECRRRRDEEAGPALTHRGAAEREAAGPPGGGSARESPRSAGPSPLLAMLDKGAPGGLGAGLGAGAPQGEGSGACWGDQPPAGDWPATAGTATALGGEGQPGGGPGAPSAPQRPARGSPAPPEPRDTACEEAEGPGDGGAQLCIDVRWSWTEIQHALSTRGGCECGRPLVLNAQGHTPFGSTYFYVLPGLAFEVMENDFLASLTVFSVPARELPAAFLLPQADAAASAA